MSQNSPETAEVNHHFQELLLAPPRRLQPAERKLSRPSLPGAPTSKCRSCLESFTMYELRALSACGHCYCKDCVHQLVDNASKGMIHFPARCCGVSIKLGRDVADFLPAETMERYDNIMLEYCQRNKRYCARASCSAFLHNSDIQGEIGTCRVCKERTCIQCKHKAHEGACKTDDDETQLLEFAKKAGWQKCYYCGQLVEKIEGCNHMRCICDADWCYKCGIDFLADICNCEEADDDDDDDEQPPPFVPNEGVEQ